MVFEEEGEDICNRDTSPAGEELYIHTYGTRQKECINSKHGSIRATFLPPKAPHFDGKSAAL